MGGPTQPSVGDNLRAGVGGGSRGRGRMHTRGVHRCAHNPVLGDNLMSYDIMDVVWGRPTQPGAGRQPKGGRWGRPTREGTRAHPWDTQMCTQHGCRMGRTNTTLQSNYPPNKKILIKETEVSKGEKWNLNTGEEKQNLCF